MKKITSPSTHVGAVHLTTANMAQQVLFYTSGIGLKLLRQEEKTAVLGANADQPLLTLTWNPAARRQRGTTGLYHMAIRVPDRFELARTLAHLAQAGAEFEGVADHLVSESFYLKDFDGNGIEIYRDRLPNEWPRDSLGQLKMDTKPLDIDNLIGELMDKPSNWEGIHPKTDMGHVHLYVSTLGEAQHFYREIIGLELMQKLDTTAAFLSANGYHHHVAINTWLGEGAPAPDADASGLRWFELVVPDQNALDAIKSRAKAAGVKTKKQDGGFLLRDPSGNGILIRI
jgi:catechol 2,3-dioxygenase